MKGPMRAVRSGYDKARDAMIGASVDIEQAMAGEMAKRQAAGADRRAREIRGFSPSERKIAQAEYAEENPGAFRKGMNMQQKARIMGEAQPFMGDPVGRFMQSGQGLVRQIAENNARRDAMGDVSRGATVAAITGGITASGAALIDLMKFLAQGQQVDAQRDDVLRS